MPSIGNTCVLALTICRDLERLNKPSLSRSTKFTKCVVALLLSIILLESGWALNDILVEYTLNASLL